MKILINTSNLRKGGGIQVAESLCRLTGMYPVHEFYIVISDSLAQLKEPLSIFHNVQIINYTQPVSIYTILTGRNKILDNIVDTFEIDAVLTVFGPSRWKPRCFHLCGFAMPHIVLKDSPYWRRLGHMALLKSKCKNYLMLSDFRHKNTELWCENEYISQKLRELIPDKKVVTITNTYNQIFDAPESWNKSLKLPVFDGITLLTITSNYPHKNLSIALEALKCLKQLTPELRVRFVFTIDKKDFPHIPEVFRDCFIFIGGVSINQCPPLYTQADIMFQPSLLECFSATYVEAMKMEIPILTTDLGFAHSICGKAALYYEPDSPSDLARKIIRLATDPIMRARLVAAGKQQLFKFDNAVERMSKLILELESSKEEQ